MALLASRRSPMNAIYVGLKKEVKRPKGEYLFIHDEVPKMRLARVFDPSEEHSFNPLEDITYKKARELAEVLYNHFSARGEHAHRA
jgi:hypothetical protein